MLYLKATDHAFASGPAFCRPDNFFRAWRATHGWRNAFDLLRLWKQFENSATMGDDCRLGLNARIVNKGARQSIEFGSHVILRGIVRNERNGRLRVGDRVYIGDNTLISSAKEIVIEEGVLIAHGVQIFDNSSHPIDSIEREEHFRMILGLCAPRAVNIKSKPVHIGRRAWIGLNAIILPGVSVGEDAVVGAGSVVVKDVPAGTLVGGSPAAVLHVYSKESTLDPANQRNRPTIEEAIATDPVCAA